MVAVDIGNTTIKAARADGIARHLAEHTISTGTGEEARDCVVEVCAELDDWSTGLIVLADGPQSRGRAANRALRDHMNEMLAGRSASPIAVSTLDPVGLKAAAMMACEQMAAL